MGQLWKEIKPETQITNDLKFYIKPSYELPKREKKSIEDIKFFEPCVGSGHILSYAFDLFYKIYEEEGYNPTEIPELIISKNLYGVDIDQRAAQLASFILLMKGRQKSRRFLRNIKNNNLRPNISFYQDFKFDDKFSNATAIGSLIRVDSADLAKITVDSGSLFAARQEELQFLYKLLSQKYDVVVTNPPYINSSRMEGSLKTYVETNHPETKTDLFATFILRCLEYCNEDGLTGYMTPFVWMFIQSYEQLRKVIIDQHFINNLIQLEYSGFDGATVPICTFTLRNKAIIDGKGSYIRLSDFKGSENQAPRTLEAIQNSDCGWFYIANQKDFEKIPTSPVGYWATQKLLKAFKNSVLLGDIASPKKGLATTDNNRFIKLWFEVSKSNFYADCTTKELAQTSGKKWFPLNKGGQFRKWYGNKEYVINWFNDGSELKEAVVIRYNGGSYTKEIRSEDKYFKDGITWSALTSSVSSFRYTDYGAIFDSAGSTMIPQENTFFLLGLLNSPVVKNILLLLNPTLNFGSGTISNIPILLPEDEYDYDKKVGDQVKIEKQEWNSREISWDFQENELLRIKGKSDIDLEEAYDLYKAYWQKKFFELHRNEEALNRQFIEIYGLQDELTPDVPLEDITILKEETSIQNNQLVFDATEVMAQFVSYAVGCMFGRYSLDKQGLVLANQGETLQDYLALTSAASTSLSHRDQQETISGRSLSEVEKRSLSEAEAYLPDDDNIIPVLDDEWFEDDIVGRFKEFLKVTFGTANFERNLAFVEESLGKDIRKYFVKDFYADHIKRYKKRPIYWMFSSANGSFNVLIYMHRYTPDTLNKILNGYLVEYREKLNTRIESLSHIIVSGSSAEQTKAAKEQDKIKKILLELKAYEREVLYPLATERISIDLDDGVLVNYNKFGAAIKEISGLNDKATKKKVKDFDWIDGKLIR
ncbi:BREX-1 system adenine-specific DNA-methyltransferase PglX [Emticicia oligotrophica]|uniref:BREX-1 system adenine-specific DNA-methyltransferase PglX n=1 Tax=Emticicia oligotrophica TaxID=312279 RepID=UPI0002D771B2|nr:BREX-1 system adenine-specific DNA-methyltransferase PglX [Emticicia oligotrophica]